MKQVPIEFVSALPKVLPMTPACAECRVARLCAVAEISPRSGAPLVTRRMRVQRGASLHHAGDQVRDRFYVVRYGRFKILQADPDGQMRLTGLALSADLMDLNVIGLERHPCTVTALEDSEVCEVSYGPLDRFTEDNHTVLTHLPALLARQMQREQDAALRLRHGKAAQRLAEFLLRVSEAYVKRGFAALRFQLPMPKADIAEYIGISAESLSRLLARFSEERLLSIDGPSLEILDADRLREAAGEW
ncbi:Crp/Fnr family transcriptional regulator [Massilia endophytica]|uniref:Crp/Fnr family transcriptional regulator n=1 Tax=Massilia endophytica TaxID=2899220 RepID=UPI001E2DD8D2|nr:helix-turn-helix domain-containing protein [Massilia endophytica]UGQ48565.1 helix-turn-helix domain-containing protein [Massilia endophytica]